MPGLEDMWSAGQPVAAQERPASGARMSPQKGPQSGNPPESSATQEEQAEFVALLNSMAMDNFYRTLAEQNLDSLPLLAAASKQGVLHKQLTHACVPDRVRTALYAVVQSLSLRDWVARHQPGARRPRHPKRETSLVFENGKLTDKKVGLVVRQTRASRCGAVWVNKRCEHRGDRDPGYQTPALLDKRVTRQNARKAWKVAGAAARWQGKFGALKLKTASGDAAEAPFNFDDCTLHVRSIEVEFETKEALLEIFSTLGDVLYAHWPSHHNVVSRDISERLLAVFRYVALREKHRIEENGAFSLSLCHL